MNDELKNASWILERPDGTRELLTDGHKLISARTKDRADRVLAGCEVHNSEEGICASPAHTLLIEALEQALLVAQMQHSLREAITHAVLAGLRQEAPRPPKPPADPSSN